MTATMEILEDSFTDQPGQKNLHAYFYFALCTSLLFHLFLYSMLKHIDLTPETMIPAEISTLIVKLATHGPITPEPEPAAPSVTDIPVPIVIPDELTSPVERITDQPLSPDLVTPATSEDEQKQPETVFPIEEPYPDAKSLIEQTYTAGRAVAKEIESLVKSTEVFNPHFKEKLETARRQQMIDEENAITPPERYVGYNQRGDRIIRRDGNCFIVPAGLLYFEMFKNVKSILAMPDFSCKKPNPYQLELSKR